MYVICILIFKFSVLYIACFLNQVKFGKAPNKRKRGVVLLPGNRRKTFMFLNFHIGQPVSYNIIWMYIEKTYATT